MNEANIRATFGERSVVEFCQHLESGRLHLNPSFQRQSVWTERDRRKLILSLLKGYPIPSVFLYAREDDLGRVVYDVLDGKQRLESIFMFLGAKGFGRQRYSVKWAEDGEERREWTWADLRRAKMISRMENYQIPVVEVTGGLADIIELFVCINSTGKALTGSEKRHARFYKSGLLKEARRLADRLGSFFRKNHVLSTGQISRMKDVELVSEIMASIMQEGVINKKAAIDKAIGLADQDGRVVRRVTGACRKTINLVRRMFPRLKETRFRNSSEFYSLCVTVWTLWSEGLILADKRRNRKAMWMLIQLSSGVDAVRDRQRRLKGARPGEELFVRYLSSIQRATDNRVERQTRQDILLGVLRSLFERKDSRRGFSPEQRRLIWCSDGERRCRICRAKLDWTNFELDHIKAHSRGGRTEASNAAVLCKPCNASKGNRRSRRR